MEAQNFITYANESSIPIAVARVGISVISKIRSNSRGSIRSVLKQETNVTYYNLVTHALFIRIRTRVDVLYNDLISYIREM